MGKQLTPGHVLTGAEKTARYKKKHPDKIRAAALKNKGHRLDYMVEYTANLRAQVHAKYGNRCNNPQCLVPGGTTDPRCLQIDHVHDDGGTDRGQNGSGYRGGKTSFYKRVLADTSGAYQLLCANCNTIKAWESNQIRLLAFHRIHGGPR
jgi:hypothetical protein